MKEKSKALQPFITVVVACPRRDVIRIWPLPVLDPWFEDWWEEGPKENAMIELLTTIIRL